MLVGNEALDKEHLTSYNINVENTPPEEKAVPTEIIPAVPEVNPRYRGLRPIKKGTILNPRGRTEGTKNFRTLYNEAIKRLAKYKHKKPAELELDILIAGLEKALEGDYPFYKDILDRLLGTAVSRSAVKHEDSIAPETLDSLKDLHAIVNDFYRQKDSRPLGESAYPTLD